MSDYVVWFEQYEPELKRKLGGKNASLGEMIAAGLPVPPGFAVTTDAYELLRAHSAGDKIRSLLESVDHTDALRLTEVSLEVRALIESIPMDPGVESDIRRSYALLCERCGLEDVPVAVRSSATAEDQPDASFAGEHDTYLWITGADAVVDHVRKCWSSLFTDRAIAYRREMGYAHEIIGMAVGVQKMVDPKAAGVAFTLNPSNGDRSAVAIDASWGLGEAVVAGEVTPDNFLVDKVMREIVSRKIGPKAIEYRVVAGGVEVGDVEEERQTVACLTDDEIKAVAAMARRAEKHYGTPQDVEWAIDRHLPDGENVILLQSRPETVWSRQPVTKIGTGQDSMSSIVATLMSPIHAGGGAPKETEPNSGNEPEQ